MLLQQHRDILLIIKALGETGECSLHKLNDIIKIIGKKRMNRQTLESACNFLLKLGFVQIDKKPDRTYVKLSPEGERIFKQIDFPDIQYK